MFCRAACQAGASPPTNPMIKAKMIALVATAGVMRSANTTSLKVTAWDVPVCMPLNGSINRIPTSARSNANNKDS